MTEPAPPRRYPDKVWCLDHAASGDRIRLFADVIGIPGAYAEIYLARNEAYVEIGGGYGGMALMHPLDPLEIGCRMRTGALPTLDDAHNAVEAFIACCWSLRQDRPAAEDTHAP